MTVLNTYLSTKPSQRSPSGDPSLQRTFVYISAEDIFSPLVPRGYITSKRAAERDIALACRHAPEARVRAVSLRPSQFPNCSYFPLLRIGTHHNNKNRLDVPPTSATANNTSRNAPFRIGPRAQIHPIEIPITYPNASQHLRSTRLSTGVIHSFSHTRSVRARPKWRERE
jgi:hypothetical protein